MYRSRPLVLAGVVAIAACSSYKDAGTKTLSQDSTLAAQISDNQKPNKETQTPPFPDACGTFTLPAPAASAKAEAEALARRAYTAEMLGNMRDASTLLHRASGLDATNKSAAYHLGRVSEALSDVPSAIRAYCRYLALSPTSAEALEARQRVLNLSQSPAQIAAAHVPQKVRLADAHRGATKVDANHSSRVAQPKRSTTTVASGAIDLPAEPKTIAPPAVPERNVDTVSSKGNVVETAPALPAPAPQRTEPRGPSRAQSVGIGAVAGAILGGVAGRSVKAAVIGAAAGGVVGGVLPRGSRGS